MKAIMNGAQSILLGDADIVVAGGMENMSDVPFYAPAMRWGNKYGNTNLIDGLAKDGLTDVYKDYAMGNAAELCARNATLAGNNRTNLLLKVTSAARLRQMKENLPTK